MFRRLEEVFQNTSQSRFDVLPNRTPAKMSGLGNKQTLQLHPPIYTKHQNFQDKIVEDEDEDKDKDKDDNRYFSLPDIAPIRIPVQDVIMNALDNPLPIDTYINDLDKSVKIYNRIANLPLNLDTFKKGATTSNIVLKNQSERNSAISDVPEGALTRQPYLRKETLDTYDFCSDIMDTTDPPFEIVCLQKLFLKMGGQTTGSAYPSISTMKYYNTMRNYGAVKQFINQLIADINSTDYRIQSSGVAQFIGINPHSLITRAPLAQGVEVFWLIHGKTGVLGLTQRTIETDIIQFDNTSSFPQTGNSILQITDIRTSKEFSVKFQIDASSGFWIAVNQPADIDTLAFNSRSNDKPGFFANLESNDMLQYHSENGSYFSSETPNIMKIYYEDDNGNRQFQMTPYALDKAGATTELFKTKYSLTCEVNAPFINYEVNNNNNNTFEDTRNPGIFSQFVKTTGIDAHTRTEERRFVPGRKGFIRVKSAGTGINFRNIAFQSWGTVSLAIRLQSMPLKETILYFISGQYYYSVIAKPKNGSMAKLFVETNLSGKVVTTSSVFELLIGKWYILYVNNMVSGFDLYCDEITTKREVSHVALMQSRTQGEQMYSLTMGMNLLIGTNGFRTLSGMYSTSSFTYDLAWVHFFQQVAGHNDIIRDCRADWIFTAFPDSPNSYRIAN